MLFSAEEVEILGCSGRRVYQHPCKFLGLGAKLVPCKTVFWGKG